MNASPGDYVCVWSFAVGRLWGVYDGNFNGTHFIREARREHVGHATMPADVVIENGPDGLRLAAPLENVCVNQVLSIHVVPPEKVAAFRDHPVA